jgi:hypothetical protein
MSKGGSKNIVVTLGRVLNHHAQPCHLSGYHPHHQACFRCGVNYTEFAQSVQSNPTPQDYFGHLDCPKGLCTHFVHSSLSPWRHRVILPTAELESDVLKKLWKPINVGGTHNAAPAQEYSRFSEMRQFFDLAVIRLRLKIARNIISSHCGETEWLNGTTMLWII